MVKDLLRTVPMSASHLVSAIEEFKAFLIAGIGPVGVVGHAHHAKAEGWHLGTILAELTEGGRLVGHVDLRPQ